MGSARTLSVFVHLASTCLQRIFLRNAVRLKSDGLEAGWLNHPISPARCHDGPTRQATRIILGVGEI